MCDTKSFWDLAPAPLTSDPQLAQYGMLAKTDIFFFSCLALGTLGLLLLAPWRRMLFSVPGLPVTPGQKPGCSCVLHVLGSQVFDLTTGLW